MRGYVTLDVVGDANRRDGFCRTVRLMLREVFSWRAIDEHDTRVPNSAHALIHLTKTSPGTEVLFLFTRNTVEEIDRMMDEAMGAEPGSVDLPDEADRMMEI